MELFIDELVKGLGAVLVGALIALIVKLLKRMGIALDVERMQQLESSARQAVLRVEETAATQLKNKVSEWTGPEKLHAAVTDVITRLPRVDAEEAERIVKAVLPTMGLGAAAGAAELGKALRTK